MAKLNHDLYSRACECMPGGVNSPVRAFGAVGGTPRFIASGRGARMTDIEGNTCLDFVASWGPLILGHAHPKVVEAVRQACSRGLSFGACHQGEVELAELIRQSMPHMQQLRLVNSGTEAAMSAVRLARAATGRDIIIKFEGCYHGHADSFLAGAGSGALTFGRPASPGVTAASAGETMLAQYNDLSSVESCFSACDNRVACVIVEPVAGNMGVIPPAGDFLPGLRRICDRHGALLIFDEVITGFRVAPGGASRLYDVVPDLCLLGKIIGGGMPIGAYGGCAELMQEMAPAGPVYQAGTLSGNPVACAAGIATLKILQEDDFHARLERNAASLERKLRARMATSRQNLSLNRVGSMFTIFFGISRADTYAQVKSCDLKSFAAFHRAMLDRNIYLPPSQFEACFLSAAHTEHDVNAFVEAAAESW